MNKKIFILTLLFFFSLPEVKAESYDYSSLKKSRFRKIEFQHVGAELNIGTWDNFHISPRIFYGIGSQFTFYSANVGIGYEYTTSSASRNKESVSLHHLPLFINANIHPYRFQKGFIYIGAGVSYNLGLGGQHFMPEFDSSQSDSNLSKNYLSLQGRIGVKYRSFEYGIFYNYACNPQFNQKYIYESSDFNYPALKAKLFERSEIGISVAYCYQF